MAKKYAPYLFDPDPPKDSQFTRKVFHDRDRELEFSIEFLRSEVPFRKICAVHGETRSGKSHFVQVLLLAARQEKLPYIQFTVNANSQGSARAILVQVFCLLHENIFSQEGAIIPEGLSGIREEVLRDLDRVKPLVCGDVTEIQLDEGDEHSRSVELSLKIPRYIEAALGGKTEATVKKGEKRILRAPSDRELIELIRFEVAALALLNAGMRVLLFIDDLDLLDRSGEPGQQQCDLLVDHLKSLADHQSILVLATIRHRYFSGRDKELKNFQTIGLMKDADLRAVYEKHIDLFNAGEKIFSEEALSLIEKISEGRVGVFLDRCYALWQRFAPVHGIIGAKQVREFVKEHLDQMRLNKRLVPIVIEIDKAVRAGQFEITLNGDVSDSDVIFKVLTPLAGRPNAFGINRLYFEVLDEEQRRNG